MHSQHWTDYKISLCERESVSHTKRVERSIGRKLPPISTKPAILVVSRGYDHLLFLVEIRNTYVRQTGSGIKFYHCYYGKIV